MTFSPCLIRSSTASGDARFALGDPLIDRCGCVFLALMAEGGATAHSCDSDDRKRGFGDRADLTPLSEIIA
jgi:hypothetical protein